MNIVVSDLCRARGVEIAVYDFIAHNWGDRAALAALNALLATETPPERVPVLAVDPSWSTPDDALTPPAVSPEAAPEMRFFRTRPPEAAPPLLRCDCPLDHDAEAAPPEDVCSRCGVRESQHRLARHDFLSTQYPEAAPPRATTEYCNQFADAEERYVCRFRAGHDGPHHPHINRESSVHRAPLAAHPATTPEPDSGGSPGELSCIPVGLPSHITPVLRAQMQRWANRMRGRYGVPVYLVGSALREDNPDPRDWDFRLTLPDDEFALRFGSVDEWRDEGCTGNWTRTRFRWSDQCVKDTKDAFAWMHVNADVQIYPESQVAMLYADLPRVRIDSFPDDASLASSPSRESGALLDKLQRRAGERALAEAAHVHRDALANNERREADARAAVARHLASLERDAARMRAIDDDLDDLRWIRPSFHADGPLVELDWFVGDGGGSTLTTGATISEAVDAYLAALTPSGEPTTTPETSE